MKEKQKKGMKNRKKGRKTEKRRKEREKGRKRDKREEKQERKMACISSKDTFFLLAEITVQLNFIVILLRTV